MKESYRECLASKIIEDGEWSDTTQGTPQGAVLSPLLANVFLHYVFDLWIQWWRTQHCQGAVCGRLRDRIPAPRRG
jgi:retron-type reverse transcriptase